VLSLVSEYVDDDDEDADDAVDDCTVLDAAVSDAVVHWSCCMLSGDDGADDGDDGGDNGGEDGVTEITWSFIGGEGSTMPYTACATLFRPVCLLKELRIACVCRGSQVGVPPMHAGRLPDSRRSLSSLK